MSDFYIPSDILEQVQSQIEYQQEVSNMLATIMQTVRDMEVTGHYFPSENTLNDEKNYKYYQEKYPQLVQKVENKFTQFKLTLSQLLRFIQIELKFVKLQKQQHQAKQLLTNKQTNTGTEEKTTKSERKNLVEVHRVRFGKKPYQINPRIFH